MPKSKRNRIVHLSKVEKKGKELTLKLFNLVREAADKYQYIHVFSVENMRNSFLKEVRAQFSETARIFFGKTKVMAKALGHTPEEEHLPNLHKLAPYLTGNVGLLFTNESPEEILEFFNGYTETDFARAGVVSSRSFTVPAGTVYSRGGEVSESEDAPLPHSVEPTLRKWGMPTRLVRGKITLDEPYEVCKEGKELNSHQTALLKMFGVAIAEFRVLISAYYSAADEAVKEVEPPA